MGTSYLYMDITVGAPAERWVCVPRRGSGQSDIGRVVATTELPAGSFVYVLFEDTGLCELYLEHLVTAVALP